MIVRTAGGRAAVLIVLDVYPRCLHLTDEKGFIRMAHSQNVRYVVGFKLDDVFALEGDIESGAIANWSKLTPWRLAHGV